VGVSFYAYDELWYEGDVWAAATDDFRGWYVRVVGLVGEQPRFPADPDIEFRLGDELERRIKEKVCEAMEPAWERLLDTICGGWKHESSDKPVLDWIGFYTLDGEIWWRAMLSYTDPLRDDQRFCEMLIGPLHQPVIMGTLRFPLHLRAELEAAITEEVNAAWEQMLLASPGAAPAWSRKDAKNERS
jgi:hypothetical protein